MDNFITKQEAVELTTEYYTYQDIAENFVIKMNNQIRYDATNGKTETTIDIEESDHMNQRSLNIAIQQLNNAGFTDIDVDDFGNWIKVSWSNSVLEILGENIVSGNVSV